MKLQDLHGVLRTNRAIKLENGRLRIGQDVLDDMFSPDAWVSIYGPATIEITEADYLRGTDRAAVIKGKTTFAVLANPIEGLSNPLLPGVCDVVVTVERISDGTLGVTLCYSLPQKWKFSDSFPEVDLLVDNNSSNLAFDGLRLAGCHFYLTTHDHKLDGGSEVALEQGLNFVGRWTPDGTLGLFEGLQAGEGSAEKLLHGPVLVSVAQLAGPLSNEQLAWDERRRIPGIHLRADLGFDVSFPPGTDKGMKLAQVGLRLYTPLVEMPVGDLPHQAPSIDYVGELFIPSIRGQSLARMKAANRTHADDELVITGSFEGVTLDNIAAALKDIAGGDDAVKVLPEAARSKATGLGLRSASITLLRTGRGYEVGATQFNLGMGEGAEPWSPFSAPFRDLIKISLDSLKIAVVRPFDPAQRALLATLSGRMAFLGSETRDGVELDVEIRYPDFYISATQQGVSSVDLRGFEVQGLRLPDFLGLQFDIADIALIAAPGKNYSFSMRLAPGKTWQVSENYSLPHLSLAVSCATDAGASDLSWRVEAGTDEGDEPVPVVDMIRSLCSRTVGLQLPTDDLPTAIKRLTVSRVGVSYSGKTQRYRFECRGRFPLLELEGQPLTIELIMEASGKDGKFDTRFHGALQLRVRQSEVSFQAEIRQTGKDLVLSFFGELPGGAQLKDVVADFAVKLGGIDALPELPDALNPALRSVSGYLNTVTKDLVLSAETASGSRFLVVAYGKRGDKKYAILVDKLLHLGLSSLPLVGDRIAAASGTAFGIEDFGLERLQALITYGVRSKEAEHAEDIGLLNDIIEAAEGAGAQPGDFPRLSASKQARIQPGDPQFRLRATYYVADKPQAPISFLDGPADQARFEPEGGDSGGRALSNVQQQATWLDVQRSFGPVSVKRVGIEFVHGEVRLLLDASLAVSGLSMDLQGLSLGVPLSAITKFNRTQLLDSLRPVAERMSTRLDGLTLSYENGPIALSGGLLSVNPPPDGTLYACNGQLLLKADTWALSVVGSFAQLKGGESSLFAYGVLNATLGGPAFFFVTGIAAGFGYNRSLTLPTLSELPNFPLIAAVKGTGKRAQLSEDIQKFAYPAAGQHWVAAGVRFTSFKVFDSFALLTVLFGDRLEFGLLGFSELTLPAISKAGAPPIAKAGLVMEARYAPDDGVLKIAAQLTPNSYILSENCHLTGGFALTTWSQDEVEKDRSGTLVDGGFRAGDFVLSIGGYHPEFKPPAHYPLVPRVGANWRVNDNLNIKGSLYFALTPLAIMAGGLLEANYQRGRLKAWFSSRVDFLMYWEPLAYHAHMKVNMGASYTMGWGATTKTITAQVGADVELYGPPFGGKAVFDLSVCSFTLDFGEQPEAPQALSWTTFEERFLPGITKVCLSRAAGGLIKELPADDGSELLSWVVSADQFVIIAASAIPCSEPALVSNGDGHLDRGGTAAASFGVKPCELLNGRLKSQLTILWQGVNKDVEWDIESLTERLPRAAWHAPDRPAVKDRAALRSRILTELGEDQVSEALTTGFRLTPKRRVADLARAPLALTLAELPMRSRGMVFPDTAWEKPAFAAADKHLADNRTAATRFTRLSEVDPTSPVARPLALGKRKAMADALKRQGLELNAHPNTRYLAAAARRHELLAAPLICELGAMQSS
nr:DUF6603 domain-containing protein [uncultured Albidiferax sp.]